MSDSISAASAADSSQSRAKNAEDRKAAAALSSLNTNEIGAGGDDGDDDDERQLGHASRKHPSAADQEALGKAMSRLEIAVGATSDAAAKRRAGVSGQRSGDGAVAADGSDAASAAAAAAAAKKKTVKVLAEDVNLLVGVPFYLSMYLPIYLI